MIWRRGLQVVSENPQIFGEFAVNCPQLSRDRLAKDGVDGTGFAVSDGKSGGKSRRTSACYGQEEKDDKNAKEVRGRTEDDLEPRRRRHYNVPTASYLILRSDPRCCHA